MPGVGESYYVAEMWMDIGLVSAGGMGAARLTCAEIMAWQQGTRRALLPWEFSIIRDMSMNYLTMLHEGEKPDTLAPFAVTAFDPDVIAQKVLDIFGSSKKANI